MPLLHLNLISSRLTALEVYSQQVDLSIDPALPAEWCAVETEAARKISCVGGITSYEVDALYDSNVLDLDGVAGENMIVQELSDNQYQLIYLFEKKLGETVLCLRPLTQKEFQKMMIRTATSI